LGEAERIRVIVADDHPMFRDGLARAIEQRRELELVGEAEDGRETVRLAEELRPDVAVVDVRMPGVDGPAALDGLRGRAPETRVLFLSAFGHGDLVYEAMQAGARGFVSKQASRDEICDAIVDIGRGRMRVDHRVEAAMLEAIERRSGEGGVPALSERELEILRLASNGRSTPEIAAELHVSPETIKSNMKALFEKLEVSTRTAAVAAALRQGLLD
jgi:two-component system nitrate/nitrite response regulator NarL